MSNYRSMIDQALETARARAHTPVETAKVASAHGSFLIKEAEEIAGALEFLSLSASGGDKVAAFRQEMIRDFYKAATASPAQGPTAASGTQGIAPSEGRTRLAPKGLVAGNSPTQGSATPEARDGEKTLRESFKQAGSQSLYDVLMNNKTAGMGGPAEHDSETMAGVSTQNENSTYRKTLHTNEGPVNANRRELKKNTRARLAEAFGHTSDTLGDATASQIFPQAASRGHLKVSSVRRRLQLLKKGSAPPPNIFQRGLDYVQNLTPRQLDYMKKQIAGVNDVVTEGRKAVSNIGDQVRDAGGALAGVVGSMRGAARGAAPAPAAEGLTTGQKALIGAGVGGAGLLGVKMLHDRSTAKQASALGGPSSMNKEAYDYGGGSFQATRPVYEMSDDELARRIAYEEGETGMRTGMGALGGALTGAMIGSANPSSSLKGAALGAAVGAPIGAAGGYLSQRLKSVEANREAARRARSSSDSRS